MKLIIFLLIMAVVTTGCGIRERELELEKRLNEVNRKEQELLLKEKSLQLKDEQISKREKLLDSSIKNPPDSFFTMHPQLPGAWNVTMRCTETTCTGSAVGDTKNERWEISYQENRIVAQAFSDNKLVRVYSGGNNGSTLELSTEPDNPDPLQSTNMIVRITDIKENEMRGQREIIRTDNCHIIYSVELKKQ
jgi:hypothetical protein